MNLDELVAKQALGWADERDYTDWAESLLEQGYESDHLAILASLSLDQQIDAQEVQHYFAASLQDLGLELPTKEEALKQYALALCQQIILNEDQALPLLRRLAQFYRLSEDSLYDIWLELEEDIDWLAEGENALFNTGLHANNQVFYIQQVAEQFIQLAQLNLADDFWSCHACLDCHYIGHQFKQVFIGCCARLPHWLHQLLFKRAKSSYLICPRCQSKNFYSMSDYQARQLVLDQRSSQASCISS